MEIGIALDQMFLVLLLLSAVVGVMHIAYYLGRIAMWAFCKVILGGSESGMDHKDWKLFRCIYDMMGQHAIEGEGEGDDDRFEQCVEKGYGEIGWLIGESIKIRENYTAVRVVLEGKKEVLEYILKIVNR